MLPPFPGCYPWGDGADIPAKQKSSGNAGLGLQHRVLDAAAGQGVAAAVMGVQLGAGGVGQN